MCKVYEKIWGRIYNTMKKEEKFLIYKIVFLILLINDLINIFKGTKILYYGVLVIISLIVKFLVTKELISKNWWKKFIPFYILHLVLRNLDFINKITLYYGTLGILSIIFILLLIKLFLRKNKNT